MQKLPFKIERDFSKISTNYKFSNCASKISIDDIIYVMYVLVSILFAVHTVLNWRISLNAKQDTEMEEETQKKT